MRLSAASASAGVSPGRDRWPDDLDLGRLESTTFPNPREQRCHVGVHFGLGHIARDTTRTQVAARDLAQGPTSRQQVFRIKFAEARFIARIRQKFPHQAFESRNVMSAGKTAQDGRRNEQVTLDVAPRPGEEFEARRIVGPRLCFGKAVAIENTNPTRQATFIAQAAMMRDSAKRLPAPQKNRARIDGTSQCGREPPTPVLQDLAVPRTLEVEKKRASICFRSETTHRGCHRIAFAKHNKPSRPPRRVHRTTTPG